MIHPVNVYNYQLYAPLGSLPPKDRDFQVQLPRNGNTLCRSSILSKAEWTKEDNENRLKDLQENIPRGFGQREFEECGGALGLRRRAAEQNDLGMAQFLQNHLSAEDTLFSEHSASQKEKCVLPLFST